MVNGSTLGQAMGELQIIRPDGLRSTFTDDGVVNDFVPNSLCCVWCDDPRVLSDGTCTQCMQVASE